VLPVHTFRWDNGTHAKDVHDDMYKNHGLFSVPIYWTPSYPVKLHLLAPT
jgi:hypothetical protein